MTEVEAKYVKARIKGKSSLAATKEAKPYLKETSLAATSNRLSKNVKIKTAIEKALAKNDATIEKHARNIGKAMDATKVVIMGKGDDAFAETTPDHMTRLAAGDRMVKLLGLDKPDKEPDTPTTPINNEALLEAIKNGDIAELQRIVFKKDDV